MDLAIQSMLLQQGVSLDKYTYIEHDYKYQRLNDGDVDVISGYLSNEPYWYKEKQLSVNIINPREYGVNFYDDILFTSQKTLKKHPQRVEKFRRASLKGWQYAVTHVDEMVELIRKKYNPSLTQDKLQFEAGKIIELMDYPVIEIGHMHQQRWEHTASILQEQSLINQEVDYARFLYKPELESYWYLTVVLSLFTLLLLMWLARNYVYQHKLSKNLHRLNLAHGTANQAWFDLNLKTGAIVVSDDYPRLLGFDPIEFHTDMDEWIKNLHPDDKEVVLTTYQHSLIAGDVCEMEYRRKTKNGNWLWLQTVGQVIESDHNGNPSRAVGVHIDISERKNIELKVIDSEKRLRLSQLYGGIGSWEYDCLTDISICSDNVSEQLKYPWTADKSSWDDVFSVMYPEDRERVNDEVNYHISRGEGFDIEYRITDTEGNMRWMRTIGSAEFDSDNNPVKMRGTVQDIHKRKIAEEKLQLSGRVFNDTHEGIIITDAERRIIDVNPAFSTITGYSRAEVVGKDPKLLSSGKHDSDFYLGMWNSLNQSGHWSGEVWNRNKDGEVYAESVTISAMLDENKKVINYVGIFSDITQNKQLQEKLSQMAHYDVLTQLPNRALFSDRFHQAIAYSNRTGSQLAVCYLDLDSFKPINDNFGHDVGDKVLVEVANRIVDNIREIDTVSRQGGDEFSILLNNSESNEKCEEALKRIHTALAQPYLIDGNEHYVTASSGATIYPLDNSDIDTLLQHADEAMYKSKNSGKNKYQLFS